MAPPIDRTSDPNAQTTGNVLNPTHIDGTWLRATNGTGRGQVVAGMGHHLATLQTVQGGAGTPVVVLEGSNDGVNWKVLGTNTHAGSDSQYLEVVDKPYRFYSVRKTTGSTGTIDYYLRLAGASGVY